MPTATGTKTPTLSELADAQQNFLNAERAYEEATDKRADTIVRLVEAGVRQSAIADALGISRGRVGQIVATTREGRSAMAPTHQFVPPVPPAD